MNTYKLVRYAWDIEEQCYEHEDIDKVTTQALERSSASGNDYTYRMETWEDGELKYNYRFFQNGREFTQDLIKGLFQ